MEPDHLPIEEYVDEVFAGLDTAGTVIVSAPPGTGKTTVLPLRLLPRVEGRILVLEPRRLATRAAARRMASLLGEAVGETVGYVTRHDRAIGPRTRIEIVTEGILTRRLQNDPTLSGVSLVIFDEFHERNLQTDLGLALTLDVRESIRPDLKLIVMSATIAAARLLDLLGEVAVVSVESPRHPVDLRWTPPPPRTRHLEDHVAATVRRALDETAGDLLVFLPGMREIEAVGERLEGVLAEVLPLHGSLPAEDQDRTLAPSQPPFRKIVLSTDIAESSLTVEGVSVVVDSGLARAPRFDPNTGLTRLRTIPISRASAEQRAGRAGRLGPGVAYRLWSKMEHAGRRPYIDAEITQIDLSRLALELVGWGVSDPAALSWLDAPPAAAWKEAWGLLETLGAVADGRITGAGRSMLHLPLHPRLARMIVDADGDAALAVWLAAILEERDPVGGPLSERPVDLALRVRLLTDPSFRLRDADPGRIHRLRETARELAHRTGVSDLDGVDPERSGRVLALGFADRLAIRRGSPGHFQLPSGGRAGIPVGDPLAAEQFVVAADLDGNRRQARIRLAAALDPEAVTAIFPTDRATQLRWDGDRLLELTEHRIGGLVVHTEEHRPSPSVEVAGLLLERIRQRGVETLGWDRRSRELVDRVRFLADVHGPPWPDWSEAALAAELEDWLGPHLVGLGSWEQVQGLRLERILRSRLDHRLLGRLDELAPSSFLTPRGREVRIDYSGGAPRAAVRVQELFGLHVTPTVSGRPVTLELLSPANRPIQVTSDLGGFWEGSWQEVRKEMAGRYPKHPWPEHPR